MSSDTRVQVTITSGGVEAPVVDLAPAGGDLRRADELVPELAGMVDLMAAAVRVAAAGAVDCRNWKHDCPICDYVVDRDVFDRLLDAVDAVEPGLLARVRSGAVRG